MYVQVAEELGEGILMMPVDDFCPLDSSQAEVMGVGDVVNELHVLLDGVAQLNQHAAMETLFSWNEWVSALCRCRSDVTMYLLRKGPIQCMNCQDADMVGYAYACHLHGQQKCAFI